MAYKKEGKWLICGGSGMIILSIIMFYLTYHMVSIGNYDSPLLKWDFGTVFLIIGIIMMIIGEILRRK